MNELADKQKTISAINADLIGVPGGAAKLITPALILDLPVFEANLARMADWAATAGQRLRPHSKTHKSPEIAARQIAAGAVGISCASLREAQIMAAAGIPGILLTSPQAPGKLGQIAALAATSVDFTCTVDHSEQVDGLAQAIASMGREGAANTVLNLFIDLDVGTRRTGIPDATRAVELARHIDQTDGVKLTGVQAYQGHVQHIDDPVDRSKAVAEGSHHLRSILAAFDAADIAIPLRSGAGTGSHRLETAEGVLNEMQVGSYIFMDVQYNAVDHGDGPDGGPGGGYKSALFVETSVINDRHNGFGVTDAGLKSFATDGPAPEVADATETVESYSFKGDEHGAVHYRDGANGLPYGSKLRCIVPHCDPTVNLYDFYHVIDGDMLVDIWPVAARGNS